MNTFCDTQGTLVKRTKLLIEKEERGLVGVSVKTGVPISWLRKFAAGRIPNPSVNRVQFIFEKLSAKKLPL